VKLLASRHCFGRAVLGLDRPERCCVSISAKDWLTAIGVYEPLPLRDWLAIASHTCQALRPGVAWRPNVAALRASVRDQHAESNLYMAFRRSVAVVAIHWKDEGNERQIHPRRVAGQCS
jgi:hypothetical protein